MIGQSSGFVPPADYSGLAPTLAAGFSWSCGQFPFYHLCHILWRQRMA